MTYRIRAYGTLVSEHGCISHLNFRKAGEWYFWGGV